MNDYKVTFSSQHKAAKSDHEIVYAARVEYVGDFLTFYDEAGEVVSQYERSKVNGYRKLERPAD
jgi:hypothetical protein